MLGRELATTTLLGHASSAFVQERFSSSDRECGIDILTKARWLFSIGEDTQPMSQALPRTFVPIKMENVRVGMYVRLDCHWLKHPFARNSFKVRSAAELAILRSLDRVPLSMDPTRSDHDAVTTLDAPEVLSTLDPFPTQERQIDEPEDRRELRARKDERIRAFVRWQAGLKTAQVRHAETLHQTRPSSTSFSRS